VCITLNGGYKVAPNYKEDEARVLLRDIGVRVWCENREVVRVEPEI